MMQVQKLATRTTGEGVVATAIGEGGRAAAAVQILCETDFVGRTDQLRSFAAAVAAASVHSTPDDLQALPLADGETVAEAIARVTAELGERIALGKLAQVALPASAGPLGRCAVYVHNSEGAFGAVGRVAGVVAAEGEEEPVRKLARQVVAGSAQWLRVQDVPDAALAEQRAISHAALSKDAADAGRPPPKDAAVEGKVRQWLAGEVLEEQEMFGVEPKQTVKKWLDAQGVVLHSFARLAIE